MDKVTTSSLLPVSVVGHKYKFPREPSMLGWMAIHTQSISASALARWTKPNRGHVDKLCTASVKDEVMTDVLLLLPQESNVLRSPD